MGELKWGLKLWFQSWCETWVPLIVEWKQLQTFPPSILVTTLRTLLILSGPSWFSVRGAPSDEQLGFHPHTWKLTHLFNQSIIWKFQSGAFYHTIGWESKWEAGGSLESWWTWEGHGHVQHKPCLPREEVQICLCLWGPTPMQLSQHYYKGQYLNISICF